MEDKRKYKSAHTHSSEPQKADLTGEFVVVMENCGRAQLCLGSLLANVVSE